MKIGIIAAMTPDGIIGVDGSIPWRHKADLRRFKELTMGSAIIFGAKTYATLPKLPGRRVIVVSRNTYKDWGTSQWPDACFGRLEAAIFRGKVMSGTDTVWIGGGGEIYRLALEEGRVDFIDLTIVPSANITGTQVIRFPVDLLSGWSLVEEKANVEDPQLVHRRYGRNVCATNVLGK